MTGAPDLLTQVTLMQHAFLLLVLGLCIAQPLQAMDYVRLRDGRVIEGAILRQDTLSVIITDWEQRHLRQPVVQAFAREEVESIWIETKPSSTSIRVFKSRPGLIEIGGGLSMQTWAASVHGRRYLIQLSFQGGYSITEYLGLELAGDFTIPRGKSSDTQYDSLRFGYQTALHVVGSLPNKSPWTPYVFVGGGSALEVPRAGVVQTTADDLRSLIDIGIGVKVGLNGIGLRTELRHCYYTWTPDILVAEEVRSTDQTADATSLRITLFTFF